MRIFYQSLTDKWLSPKNFVMRVNRDFSTAKKPFPPRKQSQLIELSRPYLYYHFSVLSFYSQKAGYFSDCSARDLLGRDGN